MDVPRPRSLPDQSGQVSRDAQAGPEARTCGRRLAASRTAAPARGRSTSVCSRQPCLPELAPQPRRLPGSGHRSRRVPPLPSLPDAADWPGSRRSQPRHCGPRAASSGRAPRPERRPARWRTPIAGRHRDVQQDDSRSRNAGETGRSTQCKRTARGAVHRHQHGPEACRHLSAWTAKQHRNRAFDEHALCDAWQRLLESGTAMSGYDHQVHLAFAGCGKDLVCYHPMPNIRRYV